MNLMIAPCSHECALLIFVMQNKRQNVSLCCALSFSHFLCLSIFTVIMSTSEPPPHLIGLDRTDTAFHPNTFLCNPSADGPSTASVSTSGRKKVHFDGESIAESSGTQPTSVGSVHAPVHNDKTKKVFERDTDSHHPVQNGGLHDTLNGLGDHLPAIQQGGDFDSDVGYDPTSSSSTNANKSTTTLLPTPEHGLHHRRNQKAWEREHLPTGKSRRNAKKPIVHNVVVEERRQHTLLEVHQEPSIQGQSPKQRAYIRH